MSVVSIVNHKGGTGKTTTVLHFAAAMGLSGRRVLLVDLDPQGFLTKLLGVPTPSPAESSLGLFDPGAQVERLPLHRMHGFDLLPASTAMNRALRGLTKPTDVFWIRETLSRGHSYEIVLFDTAAAVSVFSMNAMVASDHVLIPVTPEYQPVIGAEQTYQTVQTIRQKLNPALREPFFLLTQVDARKRDHNAYTHYLTQRYGVRILRNVIRTSAVLTEYAEGGRTIFDRDITSRGARDYANATDELMRHYFGIRDSAASLPPVPAGTTPEVPDA